MKDLIDLLRKAPADHLDPEIVAFINSWSDQPKAIDVLRALDEAVFSGGASPLALHVLEQILQDAMIRDGKTYKQLTNMAMWREDMN